MSDDTRSGPTSHKLYISKLDATLCQQSRKQVNRLKVQINDRTVKDFSISIPSATCGRSHGETFIPAIELQPGDRLSISLQYTATFGGKQVKVDMDHQEISSMAQHEGEAKTYEKTERNVCAKVSFYLLPPTIRSILEYCPQFRVLIIGNSGVGKTSLIKKLFGVKNIEAAHDKRGVANIDQEYVSPQNKRFVLHDSNGFEEGDEINVRAVEQFVKKHGKQSQIKDHLHAVWLCLQVPYSGGRLLETATENFLKHKEDILGKVPLVVILTKVDLLDDQLELDMITDDSDERTFEQRKSEFIEEHCARPLRNTGNVPYVLVSTEVQHSSMFADVTRITTDCVRERIGEEAGILVGISQRASIKVNIETSIAVGKKKYWSNLAKKVFTGFSLSDCVRVLHKDIIAVWNFHDPEELLQRDTFIDALLRPNDLDVQSSAPAPAAIDPSPFLGFIKAVGGSIPDPTVVILFAVVGVVIWFAQLISAGYEQSTQVVRLLALYIVGSMFVMQIIFLLAPDGHVTVEIVEKAMAVYLSSKKQYVREQVDGLDVERGIIPGGADHILKKVETLINMCSIDDDQVEEIRKTIPAPTETR